jgi:hypothetical protein
MESGYATHTRLLSNIGEVPNSERSAGNQLKSAEIYSSAHNNK